MNSIHNPSFDEIKARTAEHMQEVGIPGAAVAIYHAGETQAAAFGATSTENPLPVTPETLFQLGSISKLYTGTVVMRLVDEGRLELDAPVRTYLPGFRLADEDAAAAVTLRHLLTHRVGWPGDIFDWEPAAYASMATFVEQMKAAPQIVPPGQIWSYANSGILVAGRVVEVVTGKPFAQAVRELLLEPLALRRTAIEPGVVMTYRFAAGHILKEDGPQIVRPWPLVPCADAEGGVAASVADLLSFARFHLGEGGDVLKPETLEAMQRPQAHIWPPDEHMGLVWFIDDRMERRLLSHGGRTPGTQAMITLVPEEDFAFVALTNADAGLSLIEPVRRMALEAYVGLTLPPEHEPLEVSAEELAPYLGRYDHPYFHLELAMQEGELVALFGSKVDVLPPQMPPMACAYVADDRLVVLEGYLKSAHLDVFRRPDGAIGWLRDGDTLYTKLIGT